MKAIFSKNFRQLEKVKLHEPTFLCQLKTLLEEPVTEDEPKPYKMAKWAYKACMDDTELEVTQFPFHSQTLISFTETWS